MNKLRHLIPFLLLISTPLAADDPAKMATQRDRLQQEAEQIRQTTQAQRSRLEALQAQIAAQRERNRLLDQQLQREALPAQKKPPIQNTPPSAGVE
ncbi:hypothetical protein [Sedimenticola sp.]|uniref:hypothetical protein n=1 Tax=Sedimenticola sp. TaxID=1940285 RepID=UPI003D13BC19